MVRVLHIITKIELGGAQQNTLDTVKYLDRNKYELYLVSGTEGLLVDSAKKIKDAKIVLLSELKHKINPVYDFLCFLKLVILFKKEKIDIVHTHSSKAGILGRFAAKLAGVKIIIHTIHGFSFNKFQNFFVRNLYIFLERITASFTDKLIVVTTKDIEKGLSQKVGYKELYTVIRSGIDIDKFKNTKIDILSKKEGLNIKNSLWNVVGMVGCFKPQKAPLDFVRVAELVIKRLPNTYFVLVGDGELRKEIESLILKLNLKENFILTGWRNDVAEIIKLFDVFVLTSLWEGLPRSILQAFALKIPVVATDVDGSAEIVEDGKTGFLVDTGDYKKISERVIQLLQDKELSERLATSGFDKLTTEFDYKEMVKNIDLLYGTFMSLRDTKKNENPPVSPF